MGVLPNRCMYAFTKCLFYCVEIDVRRTGGENFKALPQECEFVKLFQVQILLLAILSVSAIINLGLTKTQENLCRLTQ